MLYGLNIPDSEGLKRFDAVQEIHPAVMTKLMEAFHDHMAIKTGITDRDALKVYLALQDWEFELQIFLSDAFLIGRHPDLARFLEEGGQ